MPRPEVNWITFTIDGREVRAPENAMLVDAAKYGDVEIPVFCYEPKLGQPVGACRMCLVEIEGIPKLQTGCSTPVKDGMVVHTQTERVHDAQRAVVEFLLINHPLDCPVCDKGGECPLQDITYGWGPGTSRFIEPKRHFRKPLELSPLIAIDRERCILCYRCVRFSQEISEDYQLILSERGAHSYVSTFDGHPYVGPFSGNIIELCPVGALTSTAYRFRARPWDIEGAGTVCTYCPSQCNVELTVRDDRVMRVLARDHDEVDDGWLCDKGRFAYQSTHVDERIIAAARARGHAADAGELGEGARRRRDRAQEGRARKAAALAGGDTTNEEAFLLARLFRDGLGSGHARRLARRARCPPTCRARSPTRRCRPPCPTSSSRTPCSCSTATRSTTRRSSTCACARACAATACGSRSRAPGRARWTRTPRPCCATRPAPARRCSSASTPRSAGDDGNLGGAATAAGSNAHGRARPGRRSSSGAGDDVVILYGERLLTGAARRAAAAQALLNVAARLGLARPRRAPGCSRSRPSTNGRGIREAGFAPRTARATPTSPAPGRADLADARRGVRALPAARRPGAHARRPRRTGRPRSARRADGDRARLDADRRACASTPTSSSRPRPTRRRRARSCTPTAACSACARRSAAPARSTQGVRAGLAGASPRSRAAPGHDIGVLAGPDGLARSSSTPCRSTPGSRSTRSAAAACAGPRAEAAAALAGGAWEPARARRARRAAGAGEDGALRLGTWRSLWAAPEVDLSPALRFMRPRRSSSSRRVDAERLGVRDGDQVEVGANGTRVRGAARLRAAVPGGSVFLVAGTHEEPANALTEPLVAVRRVGGDAEQAAATAAIATPAGEGHAEAPPSAPLDIPPTSSPADEDGAARDRLRGGRLLRAVVDPAAQGAG